MMDGYNKRERMAVVMFWYGENPTICPLETIGAECGIMIM